MADDLLIPLAWLPGILPLGAPVSAIRGNDRRVGVAVEAVQRRYPRVAWPDGATFYVDTLDEAALDLTPPPLNADGYPTRVDGLDVAAAMLARAMRLPGSPAWLELHESDDAPAGYRVHLRTYAPGRERFGPFAGVYLDALGAPLPTIDPTDSLAVRRLMVELFRRRVWEVAP